MKPTASPASWFMRSLTSSIFLLDFSSTKLGCHLINHVSHIYVKPSYFLSALHVRYTVFLDVFILKSMLCCSPPLCLFSCSWLSYRSLNSVFWLLQQLCVSMSPRLHPTFIRAAIAAGDPKLESLNTQSPRADHSKFTYII